MVKKIMFIIMFVPLLTNAKTLEYGFINGQWYCKELVQTSKHRSENFYKGCNSNNLWDIINRDDLVWKKDGLFHTNSYNEHKRSKYVNNNCGLKYNPKDGKTYKYPKCISTFKY